VLLLLAAGTLCAAPPGTVSVDVLAGEARIRPAGTQRSLVVTGSFLLYPGDEIIPSPGARVEIVEAGKKLPIQLEASRPYCFTPTGLSQSSDGKSPEIPGATLAATVTPIEGEIHIREVAWSGWVKVPHRTSVSWDTKVRAAPGARIEITLETGLLLRVIGPAALTLRSREIEVDQGIVLVQVNREDRQARVATPAATIALTGTLLELSHDMVRPGSSLVRVHSGVAKIEKPEGNEGPPWLRYLSAAREVTVGVGGRPQRTRRFDRKTCLARFIEGWKPEGPGDDFLPDRTNEELLRQLRTDQSKPNRPPTAIPTQRERTDKTRWLRMRMLSLNSPVNRHQYVLSRRYSDARSRRERVESESEPEIVQSTDGNPVAHHQVVGGQSPHRDKAKLRLLKWHERRLAQRLVDTQTLYSNQDIEARANLWALSDNKRQEVRERIFGQPLRLHTRWLIPAVRIDLGQKENRIDAINSQITTLSGIPGSEAAIAALVAERTQIISNAEALKTSLEALIRIH